MFLQPVADSGSCSVNVGVTGDRLVFGDVRDGSAPPRAADTICDLAHPDPRASLLETETGCGPRRREPDARLFQVMAALLGSLLLASACSSGAPTDGSPPRTGSSVPSSLAPPLTSAPLDLSQQKDDPCSLLPPDLQDKYGVDGPGEANQNGVTGPTCAFPRRTLSDPVITVAVNTRSGGLENLYQRADRFEDFEPTDVAGYPGVFVNPADDPNGCILDVATSEQELILVGVRLTATETAAPGVACDVATRVMADIVGRISG